MKYIGITIGPIAYTMNLVSSPSALWASSYLFSCICRKMCEKLTSDYGVKKEKILSPYFDKDDELLNRKDGVGLFHDRVIFEAGDFDINQLRTIRDSIITDVSAEFKIDKNYLDEYVLIEGAEFESSSPLLDSGKILDSIELSAPFVVKEEGNPIIRTFANSKGKDNESKAKLIKEIAKTNLDIDETKWQLLKNGNIKDLQGIASSANADKDFKVNKYYAVIRSDGDNMSTIISSLEESVEYREFSKTCLKYCANVSDIVGSYGGFTVYAGGDDLLAIVPCEHDSATIFNLAKEINGCFQNVFKEYIDRVNPKPSLSFGIFISYYKYPLYEALQESANLLFGISKSTGRKDCVTVCVQKHSGQSIKMILPNSHMDEFLKLQESVLSKRDSDNEKFLLSAAQKIVMFRELFDYAKTPETIHNVFVNTFDAEDQNVFTNDLEAIKEFLINSLKISSETKKDMEAINECNEFSSTNTAILNAVLRVIKFYTEKGDEA